MIGRRTPAAPAANPWDEEGWRLAPLFSSVSSAVVIGRDAEAAARVALALARAVAGTRRVAIADLANTSPALRTLAGDGEGFGLIDSFRDGVSLNAVARPAADGTASLFVLPCGTESEVPEDVLCSDRWRRLAAGFADAGALLLLVARTGMPGLAALVPQTDGALSVGGADRPSAGRVNAQAGESGPGTIPSTSGRLTGAEAAGVSRVRRRRRVGLAVLGLAAVAGAILVFRWSRRAAGARRALPAAVAVLPSAPASPASPASPLLTADTLTVRVPVNPQDSAFAAEFTVELVATNTVAGANSWLRERGAPLPGVTVSPVLLGAGRARWNKVLAGAWRDRAPADSTLGVWRTAGIVRADAGLVVRTPIALLLESDLSRGAAVERVAALVARGTPAYALLQDDGTVRLFAGAFASAAAAVLLDADLRAAGLSPQVAYRTGRTF